MRKIWIASLIVATALAGCSDGPPSAFPDVNDSSRSSDDAQCPNITGTFQFQGDPGSRFGMVTTALGADNETRWSTVTITLQPNGRLHYTRSMTAEVMHSAAMALRDYNEGRYEQWRKDALAGPDLNSSDYSKALQDYFYRLQRNGPSPERSGEENGLCQDGWLGLSRLTEFEPGNGPHSYSRDGMVWFARDREGGLLARTIEGEYHQISIWCGDGCKGIPYYTNSETVWARFAPAKSPPLWQATQDALPPAASTLAAAAAAERQRIAAEKPKIPTLAVLAAPDPRAPAIKRRVRSSAQTQDTLPPPASTLVATDPRAPAFKRRVQAMLRGSAQLTWFQEEPRYINVGALVDKEDDARQFMADIGNDSEVARVEFLAISPADQKRTRIQVGVYFKPKP
jgi:hypothetical protein